MALGTITMQRVRNFPTKRAGLAVSSLVLDGFRSAQSSTLAGRSRGDRLGGLRASLIGQAAYY